ncbi:helix-turn-helix domain-containing protein [Aureimonas populi]|uniref:Helix-turn-helix domain-containing protein n=1 Tax=Aureimonas populi TaxID=1701758 RepID=A0ABW5CHG8_9HYPH|nr:helix-turn-helix transcriptional regulator [Aureimonas populi]
MKPHRDPIDVHVGSRLRLLRTARRLSLEELGRRIGVTYQQIQKYETGANRVSASTLYRIAQTLEVSISYFFDGLGDETLDGAGALSDRATLQSSIAISRIRDSQVRDRLRALIDVLDTTPQR